MLQLCSGVPGAATAAALQSPSAFVLLPTSCCPCTGTDPDLLPIPSALRDTCACCCDTGGMWSPPSSSLSLDGCCWIMDSWMLRRGRGAGQEKETRALLRTKPSAFPCLPGPLQPLAVGNAQPCVVWGHALDLSSPLGCPCPLPAPGLGAGVGTDLAAALRGQWVLCAHPLSPYPEVLPPLILGLQGGIYLIFLNKRPSSLFLGTGISLPVLGLGKVPLEVTAMSLCHGHRHPLPSSWMLPGPLLPTVAWVRGGPSLVTCCAPRPPSLP